MHTMHTTHTHLVYFCFYKIFYYFIHGYSLIFFTRLDYNSLTNSIQHIWIPQGETHHENFSTKFITWTLMPGLLFHRYINYIYRIGNERITLFQLSHSTTLKMYQHRLQLASCFVCTCLAISVHFKLKYILDSHSLL